MKSNGMEYTCVLFVEFAWLAKKSLNVQKQMALSRKTVKFAH